MGKSNNDRRRNNEFNDLPRQRSNAARGMILAGTGIRKIHGDRRDKRNARELQWEADEDLEG